MKTLNFILDRLDEPSTWTGVAILLALAGVSLPEGFAEVMAQLAAGIAAAIGIFMKETGGRL